MNENRCICCGDLIPEGRQICWKCEHSTADLTAPSAMGYRALAFIAGFSLGLIVNLIILAVII